MKTMLSAAAALFALSAVALAQTPPSPPARPDPPAPPAPPAPPTARIGFEASKDVAINAKQVKDIIGIGGRISVKDSKAKVLGGFAGDVDTENAYFENVVLAAGNVRMTGGSIGELKLAAGDVTLNTTVTGDAKVAGGQVTFDDDMRVGGDADIHAGTIDLSGNYAGDVEINGETAMIAGNFAGDVRIDARKISIAPGTRIGGDLRASNLAELPDDVAVGGDVRIGKGKSVQREGVKITIEDDEDESSVMDDAARAKQDAARAREDIARAKVDEAQAKIDEALKGLDVDESIRAAIKKATRDKMIAVHDDGDDRGTGLISPAPMGMKAWLMVLVTLGVCGALALGVAPQFVVRATERLAKEPLPSFGIGAASLIAVPAALIGVGVTIIGIPLAVLGAAAYMISIGLGLIALCLWGGLFVRTLAHQPGQETRVSKLVGWTLMGFLALALLGALPVVGRVIQILAIITGAGAVLATAWADRKAKKMQAAA